MPTVSFSYADRWWIPRESSVTVAAGFFDPEAQGQTTRQQHVTYLHSVHSDVPCVVLLGPPGMGKSTEFSRAMRAAQAMGHTAHLLSLRGISSFEMLESTVFDPPTQDTHKRRLVYLDSLDEAAASIPAMQQWLLRVAQRSQQFGQETGQELLFRISCRTADWSEQFEQQLRQVWGKEAVEVFQLPPLTRLQATNCVSAKTTRTQDFFAVLEDYNTESFASLPVTLNMLLNTFISEGALSRDKTTIYRRGLLALLEESNRDRRATRLAGDLSPEQRFAIAARMAAASTLSARSVIWDGFYSDPTPSNAIPVADLVGDIEEAFGDEVRVGSGLGQVLADSAPELGGNLKQIASDCVLEVSPDGDGIVEMWMSAVVSRLSNLPKSFSDAKDLRSALAPKLDWGIAAQTVTAAALRAMQH